MRRPTGIRSERAFHHVSGIVSVVGAGIFNLIIGLLGLVAGLTGRWTLWGTDSSIALAVVGAGIAGLGVYQLVRSRRR